MESGIFSREGHELTIFEISFQLIGNEERAMHIVRSNEYPTDV